MSQAELVQCLDEGKPVILMLQAWADRKQSYAKQWNEGHYVVAIGYDDEAFYVEDPSLHGNRGFILRKDLDARWHDVEGRKNVHTERLGIAIWSDARTDLNYRAAARRID